MAKILEINDGGADPNTPSITEMRESQADGNKGNGTSQTLNESAKDFNQGFEDFGNTPKAEENK
jgi:hypothetical protein